MTTVHKRHLPKSGDWFVSPRYNKERGCFWTVGRWIDVERPMMVKNFENGGEFDKYDSAVAECERRNRTETEEA